MTPPRIPTALPPATIPHPSLFDPHSHWPALCRRSEMRKATPPLCPSTAHFFLAARSPGLLLIGTPLRQGHPIRWKSPANSSHRVPLKCGSNVSRPRHSKSHSPAVRQPRAAASFHPSQKNSQSFTFPRGPCKVRRLRLPSWADRISTPRLAPPTASKISLSFIRPRLHSTGWRHFRLKYGGTAASGPRRNRFSPVSGPGRASGIIHDLINTAIAPRRQDFGAFFGVA